MEILGKSLLELKALIIKRQLSEKEILDFFYQRIEKYNQQLNVYLTVVKDKEDNVDINENNVVISKKKGIPLAVKDNFCTQGITTTAASKILKNFVPPYESTVTQRLVNSGFFIIGKTNMDAWAHGSSTETSDFGPTKNPWDLSRSPGGSSGGSAVAVASYLAPAAIGSETAGSIRQPAAWSGVVGLKPTYGRVSRYGLIAMGSSLDCPGPLTLTVSDAAYLLEVIAGKDEFDATSSDVKVDDYLSYLKEKKRFNVGVADEYFDGVDSQVKKQVEKMIAVIKKLGHRIKKIKLISPKYAISVYTIIQRAEVSSNLSRYDGIRYGNPREFFGDEAKRRIMLGTFALSYGFYDAFYKKAVQVRQLIIEDFKKVFENVDLIVAPTTPITALKLGEFEKYPFFGEMMDVLNEPAAVAGLPAINIPVGLDNQNLPIGMQIVGRYFDEKSILNLAYQLEKETGFFGLPRVPNNFN